MTNSSEEQVHFWDNWHDKIIRRFPEWGSHFPFAEEFLAALPQTPSGPILDLGCGQCNDSIYFAKHGFEVYAIDFSSVGLDKAIALLQKKAINTVHIMQHDFSQSIPFEDTTFLGVYSHLALHYFDDQTTRQIFKDIWRVLISGGVLGFSVKSVKDVRYGEGDEIGPDMFNYHGHIRHFFRTEFVEEAFRSEWTPLVIREEQAKYGGSSEESNFIKVIVQKK